jgi:hypothetical protein
MWPPRRRKRRCTRNKLRSLHQKRRPFFANSFFAVALLRRMEATKGAFFGQWVICRIRTFSFSFCFPLACLREAVASLRRRQAAGRASFGRAKDAQENPPGLRGLKPNVKPSIDNAMPASPRTRITCPCIDRCASKGAWLSSRNLRLNCDRSRGCSHSR